MINRDDTVRVLTASEDPAIHDIVERALRLLGDEDAAALRLIRATTAAETLALAGSEHPRVAFLDVTIGHGAGVGLVHFLQSTVPGLIVVAIVPEGVDSDVRLVEQAAALGAAYVLLGELTGDDVLRAFTRVAPTYLPSRPPPRLKQTPAVSVPVAPIAISEARSFKELQGNLATLARSLPSGDGRSPLLDELRSAIERCVVQERAERSPMQDPTSSAYSFAYFVDLAGREIDLARRHSRRFALATVDVAAADGVTSMDARAAVELVLAAVRDTDVVARADEHELLLLLPETAAKGARTLRRRVIERVRQQVRGAAKLPIRIGIASFPFDGEDLSRLLRIARRRADRWSQFDAVAPMNSLLARSLEWLTRVHPGAALHATGLEPLVPIDVPLREAWTLFDTIVHEATRGGDATVALHAPHDASESALGLSQGIRAATLDTIGQAGTAPASRRGDDRDVLSLLTGVSRLAEGVSFGGLEVVGVLAEHACYGLIGRIEDGRLLALQGHDLPFVEALLGGLEQPVLRRGSVNSGSDPSGAPSSARGSRSDPIANWRG